MSSRIKKYGGPPLLMRNERDKKLFKELKTKYNKQNKSNVTRFFWAIKSISMY